MALVDMERVPDEVISTELLMPTPDELHETFSQETLAPELAEQVWLDHDEVIELFAWARAKSDVDPNDSEVVETQFLREPDFREKMPVLGSFRPSEVNTLQQVRGAYDIRRIQRIGQSISEERGQLQNCGVAYLNEKRARTYLAQVNRFFGTKYSLPDLQPDASGKYAILIWGHNRAFGIRSINIEENGHEDIGFGVEAKIYPNISFEDAIRKQFVENTGEAPPLHERAYGVRAYIESVAEHNGHTPVSVLAKELNMSVRQVEEALTYFTLPEGVRHLVERTRGVAMPFSTAIHFAAMEGVCSDAEIIHYAERSIENGYSGKKVAAMVRDVVAVNSMPETVQAMIQAGTLSRERAIAMKVLLDVVSDAEISILALEATANDWDNKKFTSEVNRLFNNARSRQSDIFMELTEEIDAQQVADEAYWRRNHGAMAAILRKGAGALQAYLSMSAILAKRGGGSYTALPERQVQALFEACQRNLAKLETIDEANIPEALQEHFEALSAELLPRIARLPKPEPESEAASLF